MNETELYDFMTQHKLGVLGTLSRAGTPQSALVGIAITPRLEIVFDTVKSSRKYANLKSAASCSFVIGWAGEQTVQYEGRAEELKPPEIREIPGDLLPSLARWARPAKLAGDRLLRSAAGVDSLQRLRP